MPFDALATLAHLLTPELGADAPETLRRVRRATGSEDPRVWLDHLVAAGALTSARRAAVMTAYVTGAAETGLGDAPDLPRLAPPAEVSVPAGRPTVVDPIAGGATETNFRFGDVLGRGGMGCVYRATDLQLGRDVAFKLLAMPRNPEVRERFVREARITATLDHPNIVPIHVIEASADGQHLGYAMKLVEGRTLAALIREAAAIVSAGKLPDDAHAPPALLDHFLRICDAIAFAHNRGILHRDLKPANIMVGPFNEVYVMDWGVARRMGVPEEPPSTTGADPTPLDEPGLTRVGQIVGTPRYMSPEQARGLNDQLDGRSDQYALGVILFELVSLRRAVPGETGQAALASAAEGRTVPLEHIVPGRAIPRELAAIIRRATARDPEERYPTVTALADDVRRCLRGEAVLALPDPPMQRVMRWMSRHRQATLAVVLAAITLTSVVSGLALWRERRADQIRADADRRSAAAELAARERGARLTAYLGRVALQGHRIDGEFAKLERALEGLRTAAVWALTGPAPSLPVAPGTAPPPLYFDEDFASETRRPPDFGRTAYRWPVSLEHPVIGLAPDARARKAELLPTLQRLEPLRHHMRRMFVEAVDGGRGAPDPALTRRVLAERLGPIDYAYVCLPDGVHFMLPGMDALPPGYDVRTAGFYQISDHQRGKRWGAPYIDSTTDAAGDDLVLPVTEGLWSDDGRFLGVAGVEITVTKMVETALRLPDVTTVRQSLLRNDGRKVIDTGDAGRRFPNASGKDEGLELFDFDIPAVVAAVRAGGSGVLEIERTLNGQAVTLWVAYVPLDVLGWSYVVEATPDAVMAAVRAASP
jgi:serine/threonine protein kinase